MDKHFEPLLFIAALRGNIELAQFLIEKGADVNMQDEYGFTAMYDAACNGHSDVVKMLLDGGARPDLGPCPIDQATMYGHVKVMQLLLDSGVKINQRIPGSGMTLLHIAAVEGQKDAVKLLLERGADHSMPDRSGLTALNLAQNYGQHTPNWPQGQKEVVKILYQHGVTE